MRLTAMIWTILCLAAAAHAETLTPRSGGIAPCEAPQTVPLYVGARGGIVSHHGLASAMISRFYSALKAANPGARRAIVIGPDHFMTGRHNISLCPSDWTPPGGVLKADGQALELLKVRGVVGVESLPFRQEHSIGLQVCFLKRFFPDLQVVSLIVKGDTPLFKLRRLIAPLAQLLSEEGTVIILSMDFSHEKMPAAARAEDDKSLSRIVNFETEKLKDLDVDAPPALWLFLRVLQRQGLTEPHILERACSSEIVGRPDLPCTSYASVLFRKKITPLDAH